MVWQLCCSEEILKRASIKSIETFISADGLRWYGHVARMPEERLPQFLLNWNPNYGKSSGAGREAPKKTGDPVFWRMQLTLEVSTTYDIDLSTVQAQLL